MDAIEALNRHLDEHPDDQAARFALADALLEAGFDWGLGIRAIAALGKWPSRFEYEVDSRPTGWCFSKWSCYLRVVGECDRELAGTCYREVHALPDRMLTDYPEGSKWPYYFGPKDPERDEREHLYCAETRRRCEQLVAEKFLTLTESEQNEILYQGATL